MREGRTDVGGGCEGCREEAGRRHLFWEARLALLGDLSCRGGAALRCAVIFLLVSHSVSGVRRYLYQNSISRVEAGAFQGLSNLQSL